MDGFVLVFKGEITRRSHGVYAITPEGAAAVTGPNY